MTRRRSVLVLVDIDRPLPSTDRPTLGRVVATADAVADDVVVACPADHRATVERRLADADSVGTDDYRLAVDPVSGDGPVAAIRTGVRVASGATVAVVAGDARVDAALLGRLFDACGAGVSTSAPATVVPVAEGRLYPLHAVYDAAAVRTACDRTLASGSGRLHDVLARLDATLVAAEVPSVQGSDPDTRARATVAPPADHVGT